MSRYGQINQIPLSRTEIMNCVPGGAQCQGKRQWAENEPQEVLSEQQETLFYHNLSEQPVPVHSHNNEPCKPGKTEFDGQRQELRDREALVLQLYP